MIIIINKINTGVINTSKSYHLLLAELSALMERGIKEFLYLCLRTKGVLKRKPDGNNMYSPYRGWVVSLQINMAFKNNLFVKNVSKANELHTHYLAGHIHNF